jgi:phosphinothricin acetyltransferase
MLQESSRPFIIRPALSSDAAQICDIYNPYIANTHITFEEELIGVDTMAERIAAILPVLPWLVWEERQEILGFAYAARWKERSAYRHSVESTIYLRPDTVGQGIGTRLYAALLEVLCGQALHAVIGGISLPNEASVALHEKLGFVKIAQFPEVGRKFDRWIDVGYWQKLL